MNDNTLLLYFFILNLFLVYLGQISALIGQILALAK